MAVLRQPRRPGAVSGIPHGGTPCQQGGDAKGFKGRGAHRAVRAAQEHVDHIHAAMDQLVQDSKEFARQTEARVLDLAIHRRSGTQQHSLRWREPGSGGRHIGWHEVEDHLRHCSQLVRERYRGFTAQARSLNQQEKQARAELRRARSERDDALSIEIDLG
jgi:hypothetical protein